MKNLLCAGILITLLLTTGCVRDRYQNINPDGTQRQPWGDDYGWQWHLKCSEKGKQVTDWNNRMDKIYSTNKPSVKH